MSRSIVLNQAGRIIIFVYVYMPFANLVIKKPQKIHAVKNVGLKVFLILSFVFKIIIFFFFPIQSYAFNFLATVFKYFLTFLFAHIQ